MDIQNQISTELSISSNQVKNTIELFEEGATIPFIARYRKEKTGSLTETHIRDILHKYQYYTELEDRKGTIIDSIQTQGKLTQELKNKIIETISKVELEDLYLPYKPKRITRGKKAIDAGLQPLAEWLVSCNAPDANPELEAGKYIQEKASNLGYTTIEKILKGAGDILAEELSDDAENRKWLREWAFEKGDTVTQVRKDFTDKKTKYSNYYDYSEAVKTIPSHRVLAILRGEREKVLRLSISYPEDEVKLYLRNKLIRYPGSGCENLLIKTVDDSLNRLLSTATETEIRKTIRETAEEEAFKVFNENLRTLLLSPPAGQKVTMGVDPGFRTGCKVVVVDSTGKLLTFKAIYPTEPRNDIENAMRVVNDFISKFSVELIAIGNGTASRETEKFINDVLNSLPGSVKPISIIVSESGASVYSASETAVKEFPDQDVTVRGAVSIARRLQDPLSELVKIDPKAIGIGQYQHDVNQTQLKKSLEEVVESCVNRVGVDINLASEELLQYVSGLNSKIAKNIVSYRNENGTFISKKEILKIKGLGEKTFEQAAGFLRIPNAPNLLDNSSVHPERYDFVIAMAKTLNTTIHNIIGNTTLLRTIDKNRFVSDTIGIPTIEDIISELEKPGRDPREKFTYAKFDEGIHEIKDLAEGMKLEGTITNVTNFGAFVDIGVHQDGLVHISEMADKFVKDPTKIVKVGQVVKVTVVSVDEELKRISLTMKSEPGIRKEKIIHSKNKEQTKNSTHSKNTFANKNGSNQKKSSPKKFTTSKPKFSLKQFMK